MYNLSYRIRTKEVLYAGELNDMVALCEADIERGASRSLYKYNTREIIEKCKDALITLAYLGNKLIGFAILTDLTDYGTRHGLKLLDTVGFDWVYCLEQIVVDERCRSSGVGRCLFAKLGCAFRNREKSAVLAYVPRSSTYNGNFLMHCGMTRDISNKLGMSNRFRVLCGSLN